MYINLQANNINYYDFNNNNNFVNITNKYKLSVAKYSKNLK